MYRKLIVACFVIFALGSSVRVSAQSVWQKPDQENFISLEVVKPIFDGDSEFSFLSSVSFLTGKFNVSSSFALVGEIPFALVGSELFNDANYASSQYGGYGSGYYDPYAYEVNHDVAYKNLIGNPYIGVEIYQSKSIKGELGIRIPVIGKDVPLYTQAFGMVSDFIDRPGTFFNDVVPIKAAINYIPQFDSGFFCKVRGGLTFWLNTINQDDSEQFLNYSAQAGFEYNSLSLSAGFSGLANITERRFLTVGEKLHQLGFVADYQIGQFKPGLTIKAPLGDLAEDLHFTMGLSLSVQLN